MDVKRLLVTLSLFAFAAASAYANDTSKHKSTKSSAGGTSGATSTQSFEQLDKNHDGKVSRQEWNAAHRSGASGSSSSSHAKRTGAAK